MAVTDHAGLYGSVRFVSAAQAAGIHPVVGLEIELLDAAVADPAQVVIGSRRPRSRGPRDRQPATGSGPHPIGGGVPGPAPPTPAPPPGRRGPRHEGPRGSGRA